MPNECRFFKDQIDDSKLKNGLRKANAKSRVEKKVLLLEIDKHCDEERESEFLRKEKELKQDSLSDYRSLQCSSADSKIT